MSPEISPPLENCFLHVNDFGFFLRLYQVEEMERRARGQILTTRFDEPLPLSSSPAPSTSSHPHNPTQQPSREGRGTSLRWSLLSQRLPEAVERVSEPMSVFRPCQVQ